MGFLNKVKGFISNPTATFRAVKGATIRDALKYAFIWYVIFGALLGLILGVLFKASINIASVPDWINNLGFALIPLMAILLSIFGILGILIVGAWQHLWVRICGGKKGYAQTVKAGAYGATPSYLLGWIPYVGALAGGIGATIVTIIGLRELHEISTGRAIAAWLLAMISLGVLLFTLVTESGSISY